MVTGRNVQEGKCPKIREVRRIFGEAQVALWHLQELPGRRRGGALSGKVDPMAGRLMAEEKWS